MSLFLKRRMCPLFWQEVGYLTLQRIGRAERSKRLTREKLARRGAEFRGESPASESSDAEKPTPSQSPELAPGEPKNSAPLLLAGAPPSIKMLSNERSRRRTADRPSGWPVRSP